MIKCVILEESSKPVSLHWCSAHWVAFRRSVTPCLHRGAAVPGPRVAPLVVPRQNVSPHFNHCGWNYTACAGMKGREGCITASFANKHCVLLHGGGSWICAAAVRGPNEPTLSPCIIKVWFHNRAIGKSRDRRFCSAVLCHTSYPPPVDLSKTDRPPGGGGGGGGSDYDW